MARRKSPAVVAALLPALVSAEWLAELSDAALRDNAGPTVFSRGLAYWREGAVELLRDDGHSASFQAQGTQLYGVELHFEDPGLHVHCTCPHAGDGHFCKHMVAAAMVWRQALGGEMPAPAAAPAPDPAKALATQERMAKSLQTRAAKAEHLRAFLAAQPAQALAERLWDHAQRNRDLMAELKGWAAASSASSAAGDPKSLRRAVEALMKLSTRQVLEPAEVRAWAVRAGQACALLTDALKQHPAQGADVRAVAESAMRAALLACDRMHELAAMGEEVYALFMRVVVDALRASPPPPAWADQLLQRMLAEGGWAWQAPEVLEAAGPEVARAFSKRLAQRWAQEEAATRPGEPQDTADMGFGGDLMRFNPQRDLLRGWMQDDLERQGDLLAVFAFLKRTAQGVVEHMGLVQWCDENGRPRDALQIAQANCKAFKHHPRAEDQLLALYERDGWDDEALAIRQRRFDAQPSPVCYGPLVAAARRAKADLTALRLGCHQAAAAREQAELKQQVEQGRRFGPHWTPYGPQGLNVSWRAGFHVLDGELDDALALVQPPHTCDPRVLEDLADRLPKARSAAAFALLVRCLEFELGRSKTPYREPLRLVAKARAQLNSQDAKAWLLSLAHVHKAKRNFVAALPPSR
jgi:hypothetical protein